MSKKKSAAKGPVVVLSPKHPGGVFRRAGLVFNRDQPVEIDEEGLNGVIEEIGNVLLLVDPEVNRVDPVATNDLVLAWAKEKTDNNKALLPHQQRAIDNAAGAKEADEEAAEIINEANAVRNDDSLQRRHERASNEVEKLRSKSRKPEGLNKEEKAFLKQAEKALAEVLAEVRKSRPEQPKSSSSASLADANRRIKQLEAQASGLTAAQDKIAELEMMIEELRAEPDSEDGADANSEDGADANSEDGEDGSGSE